MAYESVNNSHYNLVDWFMNSLCSLNPYIELSRVIPDFMTLPALKTTYSLTIDKSLWVKFWLFCSSNKFIFDSIE